MGNVDASEGRVHAGGDAGIDIDQRIDMRDGHDAGVHERDAEIEDVGMRVEVIGGRVDRLGAFQGDKLTGLDVDAARKQPGSMRRCPEPAIRHQNASVLASLTPGSVAISASTFSGTGPSTVTSAIAEPPSRSRPSGKVAILIAALPRRLAKRPMKPGLSSLLT